MRKITTLDNISDDLVATDLFEVVDISDDSMAESGTNKRISASQLANGLSRILSDRVSIVTSTSGNAVLISQSGGGNALLIRDEADDTSPFVVNGIGNVGIGTQLPTEKLDVIGIVKATGFVGPLTGNSSTATALASPRTIAITGDITGTATSFDGTSNITISSSITAGSIVNADINPSAAIAGTKIIPDFGSQSISNTGGNLTISKSDECIAQITSNSVIGQLYASSNNSSVAVGSVSNNPLVAFTNNAERARISASGNVVIGKPNSALSTAIDSGSANPPPTLGVYGAGISSLAVCGVGPVIRSFGLAGTIDIPLANIDGYDFGGIVGFPWNGSSFTSYGTGGTAGIRLTSKGAQTPTNGGSLITFGTTQENTVGAVERVRIDHTGNVGIGTPSPLERLSVVGGGEHAIARFVGPSLPVISKDDQGIVIQVTQGNSTVEKRGFIDFRNENDIAVTSINSFHFPNGGCDLAISATDVGSRTTPRRAEIMRLKGNGNVGIGTNDPKHRLQVEGNMALRGNGPTLGFIDTVSGSYVGDNSHQNAIIHVNAGFFYILTGNANDDGTFDWAYVANNRWPMELNLTNNNAVFGGNVNAMSFTNASDYRLKEDFKPIERPLEKVLALKPINFKWIYNDDRVDGFIAHEVQEILPDAVFGEKDAIDKEGKIDSQHLNMLSIIPVLTAAMQEQQKMIDSLTSRLAALETPKS